MKYFKNADDFTKTDKQWCMKMFHFCRIGAMTSKKRVNINSVSVCIDTELWFPSIRLTHTSDERRANKGVLLSLGLRAGWCVAPSIVDLQKRQTYR